MKCRICSNEKDNAEFIAKEMMFGNKHVFRYFQCSSCNCMQLCEFPENISDYYPPGYYSYHVKKSSKVKGLAISMRNRSALYGKGFWGKLLLRKFPNYELKSLSCLKLRNDSSILDIGCGAGHLLLTLYDIGMKNMLGIDPFLEHDIEITEQFRILRKFLKDVEGKWDLVMFHHSFEHIFDPLETLLNVHRLLKDDGHCVIRIPVAPSYAWEQYRENWVQLDVPRHLFIHSLESMSILAEQANLEIYNVVYDSTSFQFWGSEQYKQGIPLLDKHSYGVNPSNSIFSKRKIKEFQKMADGLNSLKQGDQAIFYIKKRT